MSRDSGSVKVLHVDDEPDFAVLTAEYLRREDDRFEIATETGTDAALDYLERTTVDCVVSDYDMPGRDGIELLRAVRARAPELPFILYTGKGSEEIASEAISAGVTDYMQKATGTEQYEVLANRIRNAVARHRVSEVERRAETVLESSPTPTMVVVDGEIAYANPAAEALLSVGDVDGLEGWNLAAVTQGEPGEASGRDDELPPITESTDGVERRWQTRAGDELIVELTSRPITWAGQTGALLIAQDITEWVEREQELERQNDLFERAQSIADVGAWEHDVRAGESMWTDQVFEIHGLPLETTPSPEASIQHFHPDDQPEIRAAFERALETGEPYELELRFHTADGELRWVHTRGEPQLEGGEVVRIRGTIQDITDREGLATELQILHERFEFALEVTNTILFEVDPDTGAEDRQGPFERVYGLPPEAVETNEAFYNRVVHPDDRAAVEAAQKAVRDGTQDSLSLEYRTNPANGEIRWLHSEGFRAEDAPGHGGRLIGLATDITPLKERERALEDQIERLDAFASIVSHDLRNPLTVAKGRLELAKETGEPAEFDAVERALDRMHALIEDLLELARGESGETERDPVDLAGVVNACWRDIESGSATLQVEVNRLITADRRQLERLLQNLLANAIEHGGSDVAVRVGELQHGFYVEDDGPGIDESARTKVFDSGYSSTDSGTGLGLTIVERVSDAHGWRVSVSRGSDGGARFEVTGVEWADE